MARPDLSRGAEGDDVRYLQERLAVHLEHDGVRLSAVDGDFGPITEGSVIRFQQIHGLTETGAVDSAVWDLLDAEPVDPGAIGGGSTTTTFRPIDLTIPWSMRIQWTETTLDQMNFELSQFDLRRHPGASLDFLQPVGRLFGNTGIEVLNLELRTWPNWFLTWSTQAVVNWSDEHGLELGTDQDVGVGVRPLRGVDLTATGNLDLRWFPMQGTGRAEPSGTIMLNIDLAEIIPALR